MTTRTRILYYILLLAFCILIPFLIMVAYVLITKVDDEVGFTSTLLPGVFITQFLFGLFFLKANFSNKIILDAAFSLFSFSLFAILSNLTPAIIQVDSLGISNIVLCNFLSGLITWEIYFHINKRYQSKK